MKKIKIICTLGPSSFKKNIIKKLKNEKVDIFRINLSHTNLEDIQKKINFLKKCKVPNICIDTEGAQIRTTFLKKEIFIKKNKILKIYSKNKKSNRNEIYLQPNFQLNNIKANTKISIGFNNLNLKVLKNKNEYLLCKVIDSGNLGANKGVHINSKIKLNNLSDKDKFAISILKKNKLKHIALSFVNNEKEVIEVRKILGPRTFIISKIETKNAIKNIKKISKYSNALLIDRGDLSREIPIESIPLAQEKILFFSRKNKVSTYIATNLLETMISENQPTRAESHDIYSSLKQGTKGLVLAAETAIGKDPISCVKFLKKCIKAFMNKKK